MTSPETRADSSPFPRGTAVIVAGGTGERFGDVDGKQLASVLGIPLLARTVESFDSASSISEILLVCHPDRVGEYESTVRDNLVLSTPLTAIAGGQTRQDSVGRGLHAASPSTRVFIIHDGARPLVSSDLIDEVVSALLDADGTGGLIVGHPAYDTLKRVEGDTVISTPDRSEFWVVQTPQVFMAESLRKAHAKAAAEGLIGTDDASLVEAAGDRVRMFEGPRDNIKVTVPEDLAIVEAILASRRFGDE
jgi:2-C-methyl-D-erythritol 4-phosphate cytidylyltransferase